MLRLLSPDARGEAEWTRLILALPPQLRDIHYLPQYARIYSESYGYEPSLAVFESGGKFVLQPFVRRPLNVLPFLEGSDRTFTDIANPYGYGGPLSNASTNAEGRELYARFGDAFGRWCDAEGIASEFASLHPFLAGHQLPLVEGVLRPTHEKDVVYLDLSGTQEDLAAGLNRGHRSSVSKARRAGVRVERVDATAANLATFDAIYRETMERREAAPRWFVPQAFFANTCRALGPERASLFFAYVGASIECGYLLMHAFDTAYYHFAGTRNAYPEARANNFTLYETACWARSQGFRRYHLGGGVTRDPADSLLRFKAGFSQLRAPLHTYFCVRHRATYEELCERKRGHERNTAGKESASDFLPLYRR